MRNINPWYMFNKLMVDKRSQSSTLSRVIKEIDSYFKYNILNIIFYKPCLDEDDLNNYH